jgi:hypothetical protein
MVDDVASLGCRKFSSGARVLQNSNDVPPLCGVLLSVTERDSKEL